MGCAASTSAKYDFAKEEGWTAETAEPSDETAQVREGSVVELCAGADTEARGLVLSVSMHVHWVSHFSVVLQAAYPSGEWRVEAGLRSGRRRTPWNAGRWIVP